MEIKAKEITLFPSVKLSEYPKNVNVHTEEQIDKIIQLIDFYGHRDPLIVDADIQPDGTHWVLAGNGRLQASKKAGWDNLPIIFQRFNSEEEKYGFMVSHNAVSSSGWGGGLNFSKINSDIIDLGPDFDIDMLGINNFVIDKSILDDIDDIKSLENSNPKFKFIISCSNDEEVERIASFFRVSGRECNYGTFMGLMNENIDP